MDPFIIGSAISTAGNFLGRLFGGGDDSSGRIDLRQLVKDAERAGFNPLTVLRNGGAAGYTQTHHPALSTATVVGEALGNIGATLATYDPHADEKRQAERALYDAQLENLQADSGVKMRSLNVPTKQGESTVQKIPDLYTPWRDNSATGGGKTVWLPSADLPDAEQAVMAPVGSVQTLYPSVPSTGRDRYPVQLPPLAMPADVWAEIAEWWTPKGPAYAK